jgi:hypothetical protein
MVLFMVAATANVARGHHEAIFGPQSALVLSSGRYFTAQVFTRETGPQSNRANETTTVLSAGFAPFKQRPLSVSLIVPFSVLSTGGNHRSGLEDALVGLRYQIDLPGLTNAIGGRESFAMAVGGLELPTGTLDHRFGDDALGSVVAGLLSVEKGQFSVIGYTFYRYQGSHEDAREGANLFVGGGIAWTPIDKAERLVSLQLGLSRETTFREHIGGLPVADSGGSGIFAHPTFLYGFSQRLQLFAQTTLPVHQDWRDEADEEAFRLGAGFILAFGH